VRKRVVLQGGTGVPAVLAEGVRELRARERAAASPRKPPVRLDLSFEGLSSTLGPYRRDKACKRARSRSFRVETCDAPSRVLSYDIPSDRQRRRRYKNIPLLRAVRGFFDTRAFVTRILAS
jgi:hypothetical protein